VSEGALVAVIADASPPPAPSDATAIVDLGAPVDAAPGPDGEAGADAADSAADEDADAGPVFAEAGPADASLGPFSAPTPVDAIDYPDANNTDPSMTSDGLELYFVSDRSGNQDLWVSRRDGADAAWGAPSAVDELNTPMPEQSPGVSFDGLTLWFSRSVMRNQPQIWVTTRTALGETWGAPTAVTELDGQGTQTSAKVDEDALLMVFVSTRSGSAQIYTTTRPNTQSSWGAPTLTMGLTPAGDVQDPFVAEYGLRLWFATTQAGGGDLYTADRTSVTAAFAPSTPLSELNTPASEVDPALSPDARYILFASNRSGTLQIYQASR
jgi:Tol biopolymer transport system component